MGCGVDTQACFLPLQADCNPQFAAFNLLCTSRIPLVTSPLSDLPAPSAGTLDQDLPRGPRSVCCQSTFPRSQVAHPQVLGKRVKAFHTQMFWMQRGGTASLILTLMPRALLQRLQLGSYNNSKVSVIRLSPQRCTLER